jgi:predicted DNA repair protein MutK
MAVGLLTLLDKVAMLVDDAAVAAKVSLQKTTQILGDDLAVNAEKSSGFHHSREIPVILKITKGALINKLFILPILLIISAFIPNLISFILVIGGLYLAFEAAEKVYEWLKGISEEETDENEDIKVKSAIKTDFILSIEIIIIALAAVVDYPLVTQIIAVTIVAFLATIGVYGFVAMIVKIDDFGFFIIKNSISGSFKQKLGYFMVESLPVIIRLLKIIGTIAMLLVAGGIFVHNIDFFHDFYELVLHFLPMIVYEALIALAIGFVVFAIESLVMKILKKED